MLVLSRKPNQSIRIGDNISLHVIRIKGNVIQLGIEAPQDVRIVRSELLANQPEGKQPEDKKAEGKKTNEKRANSREPHSADSAEQEADRETLPPLRIMRIEGEKSEFVTAL